jgi:hypothetical protein
MIFSLMSSSPVVGAFIHRASLRPKVQKSDGQEEDEQSPCETHAGDLSSCDSRVTVALAHLLSYPDAS